MKKLFVFCLLAALFTPVFSHAQTFVVVPDVVEVNVSPSKVDLVLCGISNRDTVDIGPYELTTAEKTESPVPYHTWFMTSVDKNSQCVPLWWAYVIQSDCDNAIELHVSNLTVYSGNASLTYFLPRPAKYMDFIALDYGWR